MSRWITPLLIAASWLTASHVQAADWQTRLRNPPAGWTVVDAGLIGAGQRDAIAKRLGVQMTSLHNTKLAVDGQEVQLNALTCATEADAARAHAAILKAHKGNHVACPRDGATVFEFPRATPRLLERTYRDWALPPPRLRYEVSFRAAPVVKGDYKAWNSLFNAFLTDKPDENRVRELAKNFTFGEELVLRDHGQGAERTTFTFSPKPARVTAAAGDTARRYSFANLPRNQGIPFVAVTATVTSDAFAITPSARKAGAELLEPTEFWPSADPEIVALARRITGEHRGTPDEVAALLAWCEAGKNLRYGGTEMGTRFGAKTVLDQKFGRCWDFSDVFVTLCRAAGVPCRQVLGWLYGQSGHVWAEVLLEGQGWRQVDPTGGSGCDCRYVPYLVTETGHVPLVYVSAVNVRELTSER